MSGRLAAILREMGLAPLWKLRAKQEPGATESAPPPQAGDARTAVAALRLRRAQGEETHMGRFLREMADGSLCPRTILLTPVSGSRFLLGCGWCNGG